MMRHIELSTQQSLIFGNLISLHMLDQLGRSNLDVILIIDDLSALIRATKIGCWFYPYLSRLSV